MAYQALYRKWRPKDFETVVGQDPIVTTLRNQIKSAHIGHAYLFTGTRGTGKTTLAKIMAKALNCENLSPDGNPCNECEICKAINEQRYPYVHEIDGASNNGIDNVREIINNVVYRPTEGKYTVYIIDECHQISPKAYDALLKTIEEPPEYVVFIFATTDPQRMPITILSRCQRYDLNRITVDVIKERLRELMALENVNVTEDALAYVAKMADGSMRDALSLLDRCISFYLGQDINLEMVTSLLGVVDTEILTKLYNDILDQNVAGVIKEIGILADAGREMSQLTGDFVNYLRNVMIAKEVPDFNDITNIPPDQLSIIRADAAKTDLETIIRLIRVASEISERIKLSANKRVDVEMGFIRLARPQMEGDVGSLKQRISQLEQSIDKYRDTLEDIASGNIALSVNADGQANSGSGAGEGFEASSGASPEEIRQRISQLPVADQETIKKIIDNYDSFLEKMAVKAPFFVTIIKKARVCLGNASGTISFVFENEMAKGQADKNVAAVTEVLCDIAEAKVTPVFSVYTGNEDKVMVTDLIKFEIEVQE